MPVYSLEIIVVALGLVMLMIDAFVKLEDKRSIAWLGILGLFVVLVLHFVVKWPTTETTSTFWNFYATSDNLSDAPGDQVGLFYKGIAVLTTIIVLIMSIEFSPITLRYSAPIEKGAHPQSGLGEFYSLPVFACAGLMWMASANNLISIFVALEAVTITFYVMVAFLRRNVGSLEAGVKYLILGALSTGFLVYGFTWLFGVTGSMDLGTIAEVLKSGEVNVTAALFAFALILIALAFKVGAFPFNFWIPDVYQGAPTPITAFLSVGSKAAGFIVLLRLAKPFLESPIFVDKAVLIFTVIAIGTLIYGNLAAIPQKNFKRLLSYSSIAHAGFLLMAFASTPKNGEAVSMSPVKVISFYMAAYLLMTLLAFLVMSVIRVDRDGEDIKSYGGLFKKSPFLAIALLISMASLAGIPLTAGFFGKFYVFVLAIEQKQWLLLAVAIIGAGAGFYYYLKIAASMFLEEDTSERSHGVSVSMPVKIVMVILMIGIIVGGIFPNVILDLLG